MSVSRASLDFFVPGRIGHMTRTCKSCILSDRVEGTSVDRNGLCDCCAGRKTDVWESRFGVTEEKKRQLRKELERAIDRTRGKHTYDCVVALSGGKDSSYLLYHFVNEPRLKVLAVHVNIPFESKVAEENVRLLREQLSFDLKIVDPGIDFYRVFYNALFSGPVRQNYIWSVCYVCGPFFAGCCLKVATEAKAPFVLLGVSPKQPENMFFEWDKDIVERKDWIPGLFRSEEFTNHFRWNFWNPFSYPEGTTFPRLIAPLHVMEYSEERIKDELSRKGILPRKELNPARTNCALNWPMIYLDTKLLGHNPYIREFAAKVRGIEGFLEVFAAGGESADQTGNLQKKNHTRNRESARPEVFGLPCGQGRDRKSSRGLSMISPNNERS